MILETHRFEPISAIEMTPKLLICHASKSEEKKIQEAFRETLRFARGSQGVNSDSVDAATPQFIHQI